MINPKEVRIDNWVMLTDDGEYFQIGRDDFEYVRGLCNIEQMSPIPLTPEILEKAGFRDTFAEMKTNDLFVWNNGNLIIGDGPSAYSAQCQSLHQLQNLYFALTGEELDIAF